MPKRACCVPKLLLLLLLLVGCAADCLAMPHLAHMAFGVVMVLLFCFATLCMVSRPCCDTCFDSIHNTS
jgi:hypothetical protein